ncbi:MULTISPECIES: hypothetical protein [unclassified Candidatus Cardinium]|uniref:hypothetical protein n=1 Tax=unclassified Candidatus Cardinium TaxID=2641185 RepID=UPI001FB5136C|nr:MULTISPECIES: hypothetical protein [unclassified Candidatus Cardinium]
MHKTLNNYFFKLGLLFAATYFMNFTNKIVYCALLLTILGTVLNGIAKCHGGQKATMSILFCTTISLVLLYNKPYCIIPGKPIRGLIIASLCAILIASYIGCKLFLKLNSHYRFAISNYISLLVFGLVDHLIMGLFFTKTFPLYKVWLIIYKETTYTYLFASIVYLCSIAVVYGQPLYLKLKQYRGLLRSVKQVKSKIPPL